MTQQNSQRVRITKIDGLPLGISPTGPVVSGYYVEGALLRPIVVDDCASMLRDKRNGVEAFGYFQTSPIVCINAMNGTFVTQSGNTYKLEVIGENIGPESDISSTRSGTQAKDN